MFGKRRRMSRVAATVAAAAAVATAATGCTPIGPNASGGWEMMSGNGLAAVYLDRSGRNINSVYCRIPNCTARVATVNRDTRYGNITSVGVDVTLYLGKAPVVGDIHTTVRITAR